ncbi:MAG: DUF1848 domain-containing protein, partial [Candidatus Marinimicrobia bacterium]|nr:DUF1848 domain-containing protein [Candidatus Neomarinimicrobiota bacterium]
MRTIISASRRTDIPAFHGISFLKAIQKEQIKVPNPFNGKLYKVSLAPEDVGAFVFWSRNYTPFIPVLEKIREKYQNRFLFHFTITGYQRQSKYILEPNCPSLQQSINSIKILANKFGPEKIFWRFDPIIFSNFTPREERLHSFENLVSELNPFVARCYFSYVDIYKKVTNRLNQDTSSLILEHPEDELLIKFARKLKHTAQHFNLPLFTCCEDTVASEAGIEKGHCIDAPYLSKLYPDIKFTKKINPTRAGC